MGALERYFVQDWKAMLNANGGRLPKPDDSPEGIKQREDFNQSMSDLRSSFGALSKDEQKQCQTYMNAAEERAKTVDDMHKEWEKANAPGNSEPQANRPTDINGGQKGTSWNDAYKAAGVSVTPSPK